MLARAFVDDPVTVAVYKKFSPEKLLKALIVDFSAEMSVCLRRGYPIQVIECSAVVGAAVIYPPGKYPLPTIEQWLLILKSIIGNGFYDVGSWMKWQNEVDELHPGEPHYYLEYIGVEPSFQGTGVGSAILRHLCEKADKQQVGCYLENANPINTPFYQRFGFHVTQEKVIIDIPTWFMWRPPD